MHRQLSATTNLLTVSTVLPFSERYRIGITQDLASQPFQTDFFHVEICSENACVSLCALITVSFALRTFHVPYTPQATYPFAY